MNLDLNNVRKVSVLGPLLTLLAILISVFLWRITRWSDARPSIDFYVSGGENSSGQIFGFKIKNPGKTTAYKLSLNVTWHHKPVWEKVELAPGPQQYVEVKVDSSVQERESEGLKAWIDFCDEYGRQYRAFRGLVQRWNAGHHKFFIGQDPEDLWTERPYWIRDLLKWRKVHP